MNNRSGLKIAAIDIGTNSIHMIIANAVGSSLDIVDREKELVVLGKGVFENGALSAQSQAEAVSVLSKYLKLAERHGVQEVLCTATSAVREASNGGEFLALLQSELNLDVQLISGFEEARIIFRAVQEALDLGGKRTLVLDIGGGSVEFILSDLAQKPVVLHSLKLGSLRLGQRFIRTDPVSRKDRKALQDHIAAETEPLLQTLRGMGVDQVVGASGTILTLGEVTHLLGGGLPWPTPNGHRASLARLAEATETLADMPMRERVKVPGVNEKRAHSLIAGGYLMQHILESLGQKEIILCDWALREGLVLHYLETHPATLAAREKYPDLRRRSVHELAVKLGCDNNHSAQVARLALSLFDQLGGLVGLGPADRELLEYASVLHDAGQHIGFADHDKHSAYIIRHSQLRGFERSELMVLAAIVRYHRGSLPKKRHLEYGSVAKTERKLVQALAGILAVADGLDRSHYDAVERVQCSISRRQILIQVVPRLDAELELWAAKRKSRLLAKVLGVPVDFEILYEAARKFLSAPPHATT